ncbi:MAG: NAD-dependent epimerase/dehydratase [Parcubacteria group bacterium GW2011_GWB1_56_8]|nr:MAG: NAD-dependent epimerase/dehydratase [Parcubacteria group bacterium GW2011_GWB1_56_8]
MKALVTGASGFLGAHLCEALRLRGNRVVALVRDDLGALDCQQITVRGGFEQVERTLSEYEIDTVFHLAAQTQVSTAVAHPIGTFEANTEGTWKVLEACRKQKVRRIIVASSDKCYGDGATPYTEKQALLPNGIYATSKACADLIAQAYIQEFGMSIAITRCGNLYGPGHTNWSTLIPGTIRSIFRGERPKLRSDGGPQRDWLYVEDAVEGYLKLAACDETGPFNFGTGRGTSVATVVETILRLMKTELKPIIDLKTGPGAGGMEIHEQILDCDRSLRVLGWRPDYTLEIGLIETIDWLKEHVQ